MPLGLVDPMLEAARSQAVAAWQSVFATWAAAAASAVVAATAIWVTVDQKSRDRRLRRASARSLILEAISMAERPSRYVDDNTEDIDREGTMTLARSIWTDALAIVDHTLRTELIEEDVIEVATSVRGVIAGLAHTTDTPEADKFAAMFLYFRMLLDGVRKEAEQLRA